MQVLEIHNFGPIKQAVVDVDRCTILIGPQASGKSTIAKAIYLFKSLKNDLHQFVLGRMDKRDARIASFSKIIKQKFLDIWGSTFHLDDFLLKYTYEEDKTLSFSLSGKFLQADFSQSFTQEFNKINSFARQSHRQQEKTSRIPDFYSRGDRTFDAALKRQLNALFAFDHDILYIPAGRSLVTTLSDHLGSIQSYKLEYLLDEFITLVNRSKPIFSQSLDEITRDYLELREDSADQQTLDLAKTIIHNIVKGDYRSDRSGEKLFFNDRQYTFLKHSSSGQQEAIWITHLVFLYILEKRKIFAVFEEPEAHLYPEAQRQMVQLLALLLSRAGNSGIITTHSPYILSALNNLLYAHRLGQDKGPQITEVVPEQLWLDPARTQAFFVDKGRMDDIFDEELQQIRNEAVDSASETINEEYDQLFDLDDCHE